MTHDKAGTDNQAEHAERSYIRWQDMSRKDYVRVGLGVVMFIVGIVGLVLPILQGVLFLIVSAILLAPYSRWVQKQLDRFETKFPWLSEKASSIAARWSPRKKTQ